jgi:hypothetical protein
LQQAQVQAKQASNSSLNMNIIVSFGLVKINIGKKIKKTEMKLRLFNVI